MKKLLSLIMALALVLSAAALAEPDVVTNKQPCPIVEEKIELTGMAPKNAMHGDWDEMWWIKYMEEKTNIHWNWNLVPSDSYQEKKNLVLASQDLPDMFYGGGISKADEVSYGSQGIFIPLNEYIENAMPNFKAAAEKWPALFTGSVTLDGNVYALPKIWATPHGTTTKYFINTVWLDTLGLEMPETLDDLYEVLCAFRDHPELSPNGTIIPFGGRNNTGSQIDQLILCAYGLLGGTAKQGMSNYEVVDGEVKLAATLPEYKEALAFIKKLYDEGLIDSEYFTQTSEQFHAKNANLQVGIFNSAAAYVEMSLDEAAAYQLMAPVTLTEDQEKIWPHTTGLTSGMAAITCVNKYPEETARWLDICFSTDEANLEICGPEGELWHWVEEGVTWVSEEEKFKESGLNSWSGYKLAYVSPDVAPLACDTLVFYDLEDLPQVKKDYYASTWVQVYPYFMDIFPNMYYTDEEQMEISSLTVDIESYIEQAKAKFIVGEMDLETFDSDYQAALEKMQLGRLLEIQQGAYDRYLANLD